MMAVEKLQETARTTFCKLEECWQTRDYGPMKPLLMPDLYAEHCSQLAGMKRNHEINQIADLTVERVDIVNVRYPHKADQREFTALISARARDYYMDDRDQRFLRGDRAAARFQEFWTFQLQQGAWLLREIEQSRESDKLKEENFVEMFTDKHKDEYTVRISAHAQKIVSENERTVTQEEYVTPFEQYWSFGRLDRQWKLKEILPPAEGEQLVAQENIDEESDPATLQWFYTKSRAG